MEKTNPELITVTTKIIESVKTAETVRQPQPGTSGKSAEKKPSAIPTPRKSIEKKTIEIKASPRKINTAESPRPGSSSENLKMTVTPKK